MPFAGIGVDVVSKSSPGAEQPVRRHGTPCSFPKRLSQLTFAWHGPATDGGSHATGLVGSLFADPSSARSRGFGANVRIETVDSPFRDTSPAAARHSVQEVSGAAISRGTATPCEKSRVTQLTYATVH